MNEIKNSLSTLLMEVIDLMVPMVFTEVGGNIKQVKDLRNLKKYEIIVGR
jgi:hypothetical protein